jgi:hypothetical protein
MVVSHHVVSNRVPLLPDHRFLRGCIWIATPVQSPALNLLPPCATAHGVRATQCKAKNACLSGNLAGWAANRTNKRARIAQRPARSQNRPLVRDPSYVVWSSTIIETTSVDIVSQNIQGKGIDRVQST